VNRTVLTAALAVARARLGLFEPVRKGPVARVRTDLYRPENFAALLRDGYLVHRRWTNAQVEVLFRGTAAQGLDPQAARDPDGTYVDLYVGYANAPTIGRALLGDAAWKDMMGNLQPGQAAYWVATAGRDPLVGPTFVRGTPPPRLTLSQGGEPLEAKDADAELRPVPGGPTFRRMLVIQTPAMAAVDPSGTMTFTLRLVRKKGQMFPTVVEKSVSLAYTPPAGLFFRPAAPLPEWLADWIAHWPQLATIAAALVLLSAVLARPRGVSVHAGRMNAFRLGYLAWTLVYLGWYAQGQLSIVQLTGAVKTLRAGQGLGSFLYDPVSLLLIVFTLVSFVAWGRGTFCGWLCPFGAMQEFVGVLARRLGVRRRRLPSRLETFLERGRYGLLAGLLVAAAFAPHLAERLVEVEPFKTAITVGFDRSWPYVAWAALLLALGAAYYKFFCRFLCPLGAAITLGGKLRLFDWLPRRRECGKPCQTCRARCEYDAIARDGRILYDRCFQCLDCVGVYHDPGRCAPLLFHARTGRNFRRPHEPVLPPPRRAGA
jgi:hypothetical protein